MTGARRWYKAFAVSCPTCMAAPANECVRYPDGAPMRGVHRARDVRYNRHVAEGLPLPAQWKRGRHV